MRLNEFMEGFGIITSKLKEMYQMITLGGDAELELVDSLDPFTEGIFLLRNSCAGYTYIAFDFPGIIFSVRPPKKSWKNISNLSGGEKTLSSLALVFALHYYKVTIITTVKKREFCAHSILPLLPSLADAPVRHGRD